MSARDLSPDEYRQALLEGVANFNNARFWDAHEGWERAWLSNGDPLDRRVLQGQIQAAAAFHLLGIGRDEPALRLCRLSLEKLGSTSALPRVEIPGLEGKLQAIVAEPGNWRNLILSLRANLIEA